MEKKPKPVLIHTADATLEGDLVLPENCGGLVIFVHGSGSGRHSSRNRFVASKLHERGLATLLFDLLTVQEEHSDLLSGELRFNIGMLARRLGGAIVWALDEPKTASLRIGLFGASTGGGAALVAAAEMPQRVSAVVSRGGRPDLAGESLKRVLAPTLLIVGGNDEVVLSLNREAQAKLVAKNSLEVIAEATHLFEEPGTLEQVSNLAGDWFAEYLKQD